MKTFVVLLLFGLLGGAVAGWYFFRPEQVIAPQPTNGMTANGNVAPSNANTDNTKNAASNTNEQAGTASQLRAEEKDLNALNLNAEFDVLDAVDRDLATPDLDVGTSL